MNGIVGTARHTENAIFFCVPLFFFIFLESVIVLALRKKVVHEEHSTLGAQKGWSGVVPRAEMRGGHRRLPFTRRRTCFPFDPLSGGFA